MAALVKHPALFCRPLLPFKLCPRSKSCGKSLSAGSAVQCAYEDFDFRNGPQEVAKPKFIRSEYPSLLEPQVTQPSATPAKRKGRRPFRKATPLQAISGAMIGGGCSVLAFKVARQAYEHLETHPPAHNLPLNLTSEVNQLMLTMVRPHIDIAQWFMKVAGFGGLVVCMFGVSCVGLGLLSVKLITAPKSPPNAP